MLKAGLDSLAGVSIPVVATPAQNRSPEAARPRAVPEGGDAPRHSTREGHAAVDFTEMGSAFVGTGKAVEALLTEIRRASPTKNASVLSVPIFAAENRVFAELKAVSLEPLSEIGPGFAAFCASVGACVDRCRIEVDRLSGEVFRRCADAAAEGCDRLFAPKSDPWDAAWSLADDALAKANARGKPVAIIDYAHRFQIVADPFAGKDPGGLVKEAEQMSMRCRVAFRYSALHDAIHEAKSVVAAQSEVALTKGTPARGLGALKKAYGWSDGRWFMRPSDALKGIKHPEELAVAAKALVDLGPVMVGEFFSQRVIAEDPGLALIWGRAVRAAGGQVQTSTLLSAMALPATAHE